MASRLGALLLRLRQMELCPAGVEIAGIRSVSREVLALLEARCAECGSPAVLRVSEAALGETLRWLLRWADWLDRTAGKASVSEVIVETVETVTAPRSSVRGCVSQRLSGALLEAMAAASLRCMADGDVWDEAETAGQAGIVGLKGIAGLVE